MNHDNSQSALSGALRRAVAAGRPGDRLPSVRALQAEHHVSPLTVQHVLRDLAAAGLVVVRPGDGTFVAAGPSPRDADTAWQEAALGGHVPHDASRTLALWQQPGADTIRLTGGYLDAGLVPERALAASLGRAMRRSGVWGRYPIEGNEALRHWFAREIGGFEATDVLITSGGQAALSIAIRALTRPGDPIVLESPTYTGVIAVARSHGLTVVPVPTDARGMRTDLLDEIMARSGATVIVAQPTFANPTGTTLAPDRRRELLDIARARSAFVIEDDYARYLTIDETPPPPLAAGPVDGHVVHVRSLTKPIAPGLRLAALCAQGPALTRLRAAKTLDDFYVPGPLQEAAVDFVASPAWARHRRRIARELGLRRDTLLRHVARLAPGLDVPAVPHGGMHLWVGLPRGVDDQGLALRAAAHRVMVSAGTPWFPAEADRGYLRLTYGETPVHQIEEGVTRLARALAEG